MTEMTKRFHGGSQGLSNTVVHNGLVYSVATDPHASLLFEDQVRNTLEQLERQLSTAGSGKSCLLQATVYLADIRNKQAMNLIWCNWFVDRDSWPQRACVGVELDPGYLVEVVVTAKLLEKKT